MKNSLSILVVLLVTAVAAWIDTTYHRLVLGFSQTFEYNFTLLTLLQMAGSLLIAVSLLSLFAFLQSRSALSFSLSLFLLIFGGVLLFSTTIQGYFMIRNIFPQPLHRIINDFNQSRILLTSHVGAIVLGMGVLGVWRWFGGGGSSEK